MGNAAQLRPGTCAEASAPHASSLERLVTNTLLAFRFTQTDLRSSTSSFGCAYLTRTRSIWAVSSGEKRAPTGALEHILFSMAPTTAAAVPAFNAGMVTLEARIQSFAVASTSTAPSRSRKTSVPLTWPHPASSSSEFPLPSHLAALGLYFAPTASENDRVVSYIDGTAISGFEAGDCPQERLQQANDQDSWLLIMRSRTAGEEDGTGQYTYENAELLPTGSTMTAARRRTFANLWPHDGKRGWKPNAQKLAQAGFHYEPTEEDPDNASCIYCGRTLSGWEKSDDAVHEHHRKKPECAFFNCSALSHGAKAPSKAKSLATGRSRSRIVSATKDEPAVETESAQSTLDMDESEVIATRTRTRQRVESGRSNLGTESEQSDAEVVEAPRKRTTRSAAVKSASSKSLTESSSKGGRPASNSSKPGKESVTEDFAPTDSERADESEAEQMDNHSETEVEKPKRRGRPKAAPTTSKPKTTRSKQRAVKASAVDDEETEEAASTKEVVSKSKKGSRANNRRAVSEKSAIESDIGDSEATDVDDSVQQRGDATMLQPSTSDLNVLTRNVHDENDDQADETARKPGRSKAAQSKSRGTRNTRVHESTDQENITIGGGKDGDLQRQLETEDITTDDEPARSSKAGASGTSGAKPASTSTAKVPTTRKASATAGRTKKSKPAVPQETENKERTVERGSSSAADLEAEHEDGTATQPRHDETKTIESLTEPAPDHSRKPSAKPQSQVPDLTQANDDLTAGAVHQDQPSERPPQATSAVATDRIFSPLPPVSRAPSGRQARVASSSKEPRAKKNVEETTKQARGTDRLGSKDVASAAASSGPFARQSDEAMENEGQAAESSSSKPVPNLPPPSPVKASAYHAPALAPLTELTNLEFAVGGLPKDVSDEADAHKASAAGAASMTVQSYLELQITLALEEMRQKGEEKVKDLEERLALSRQQMERVLRGSASN